MKKVETIATNGLCYSIFRGSQMVQLAEGTSERLETQKEQNQGKNYEFICTIFYGKMYPKFHEEISGTCAWLQPQQQERKVNYSITFWPIDQKPPESYKCCQGQGSSRKHQLFCICCIRFLFSHALLMIKVNTANNILFSFGPLFLSSFCSEFTLVCGPVTSLLLPHNELSTRFHSPD